MALPILTPQDFGGDLGSYYIYLTLYNSENSNSENIESLLNRIKLGTDYNINTLSSNANFPSGVIDDLTSQINTQRALHSKISIHGAIQCIYDSVNLEYYGWVSISYES